MKVIIKPLDEIKPYYNNPRVNDETVKALEKSIKRYGFNVPLVLDKHGIIITGHARYKALSNLKMHSAYVVIAEDLTPDQARQYRIVDNKTQEMTEWETGKLMLEIAEIGSWDNAMDFFSDTGVGAIFGFEPEEIDLDEPIAPILTAPIVSTTSTTVTRTERKVVCPFCDCEDVTRVN